MKTIAVSAFRAACLRLIGQMHKDREPITITKRGEPVAVLSPLPPPADEAPLIIGAMKGSVLRYDEPFEPACDPSDWTANP